MMARYLLAALAAGSALAQTPAFEDILVVAKPVERFGPRGMMGDVTQLKDGSLLLCYTSLAGKGIVGRKSADLGKTWGEEFVLMPSPSGPSKQGYYCHPSFVRCPNGDLLLIYIYDSGASPSFVSGNYYRRTNDEGATWTEQFWMTPLPGCIAVHNAKVRVLSSGRIIAAAHFKKRWPDGPLSRDHSGYVSLAFYSDDNGYAWHPSKNEVDMDPVEAQESHIVELKDGRLLMTFRTYSGCVGRAFSTDKGETWSKGELLKDLPLASNSCAVSVDLMPNGDLLLIRCSDGSEGRRTPLVSVVSKDDGATWGNPRVIAGDPANDYGYQSVTFVGDTAIISFHALNGLHVARVEQGWFYGQD
jgi:sialidase-1